jgi:hypothetical protein
MRLEGSKPSKTFANVQHVIFVCDCGVTTDLIIAVSKWVLNERLVE